MRSAILAAVALAACAPAITVVDVASPNRGRLLYNTACVQCHTTQAHWRDASIVRSWSDLVYQVTRWQHNAGQDWTHNDVADVAAYLNGEFYDLPCPLAGCGRGALSLAQR